MSWDRWAHVVPQAATDGLLTCLKCWLPSRQNLKCQTCAFGRGVGHHSGWLAFLQRMNVIRKVKASTGKRIRVTAAKAVKTVKAGAGRQLNQGASMVDVSTAWHTQAAKMPTFIEWLRGCWS